MTSWVCPLNSHNSNKSFLNVDCRQDQNALLSCCNLTALPSPPPTVGTVWLWPGDLGSHMSGQLEFKGMVVSKFRINTHCRAGFVV